MGTLKSSNYDSYKKKNYSDSSHDVSAFQKTISATCGAFVTSLVTTPLEVVKTRLQTVLRNQQAPINISISTSSSSINKETISTSLSSNSSASVSHSSVGHGRHYEPKVSIRAPTTSSIGTLLAVARMEGFRGLWSGLSAGLLMQIPSTILYFTAYDELKEYLELLGKTQQQHNNNTTNNTESTLEKYAPLISGILSRVLAVTMVSPLELLRTKAMYHGIDSPKLLTSIKNELSIGGYTSLWRGLGPTLLRDVPFSGIYWYGYERIKRNIIIRWYIPSFHITNKNNTITKEQYSQFINSSEFSTSSQWITSFLAGLLSGTLAAFITTPFDVVKTRKQVQIYQQQQPTKFISSSTLPLSQVLPRTTQEILSTIIKDEGISGLFAGVNMRVARVGPACAIMISSYELGKYIFAHNNNTNHHHHQYNNQKENKENSMLSSSTTTATTSLVFDKNYNTISSSNTKDTDNELPMVTMNSIEE